MHNLCNYQGIRITKIGIALAFGQNFGPKTTLTYFAFYMQAGLISNFAVIAIHKPAVRCSVHVIV